MASDAVKEWAEAIAATADNLSDGVIDPGDLEVITKATEKLYEVAEEELADELADPRVQSGLQLGAMLLRGAMSYFRP
jgi:hypothetical protein